MLSMSVTAGSCRAIARSRRQSACLVAHRFAACRAKVVRWTVRRPGNRWPKWRRKWACRPRSVSRPRNSGPPPEEWRGGIRTSRGRAHVDPFHAGPRLGRGAVAQGRVQTLPIVEDLDILEHRRPGLRTGAEAGLVDVLLLERGEEALHRRVIQAVAAPAHRLLDAVPPYGPPPGEGRGGVRTSR